MTANDKSAAVKTADDLFNKLFDLSYELSELASNAHRLEDTATESQYEALDLCKKLKFAHEREEK